MQTIKSNEWMKVLSAAAMGACGLLTGCSGFTAAKTPAAPVAHAGPALTGTVFGGRQPISGANIILYAAGATGYASAAADVLSSPVSTDPTGRFNFTNYSCTSGQQMYIVSAGGDPGAGTNANAALMAALGDCANLNSIASVNINELTTVGTAFALAPFSSGYANIGTSTVNPAGLARAFASVAKLVNIQAGTAIGPALPAGATEPTSEINTLANVLAACVNSTGGAAGSNTYCGSLFTAATSPSGTVPTDTIGAAFEIAQNPAQNAATLYNIPPAISPYAPTLASAPTDWTMSIKYGGFFAPKSTTIDANGNVWVANSGNNTVAVLAQTGVPIAGSPFSANGLTAPAAVAIDASGNGWVANAGGSTVSAFTSSGGTVSGSPFTVGTGPSALAFDASGDLWVGNTTANSVTELGANGAVFGTVTGIASPSAILIDPK